MFTLISKAIKAFSKNTNFNYLVDLQSEQLSNYFDPISPEKGIVDPQLVNLKEHFFTIQIDISISIPGVPCLSASISGTLSITLDPPSCHFNGQIGLVFCGWVFLSWDLNFRNALIIHDQKDIEVGKMEEILITPKGQPVEQDYLDKIGVNDERELEEFIKTEISQSQELNLKLETEIQKHFN